MFPGNSDGFLETALTVRNRQNQSSRPAENLSLFLISQHFLCTRARTPTTNFLSVSSREEASIDLLHNHTFPAALFTAARVQGNNTLPSRLVSHPRRSIENPLVMEFDKGRRSHVAGFCHLAREIIRYLVSNYASSR